MAIKDNLGQEVKIGDWIATIPMGYRTVVIGKITNFTKLGNPLIKKNHLDTENAVGKTVEYNATGEYRKSHFIKVIPTREIELNYENV